MPRPAEVFIDGDEVAQGLAGVVEDGGRKAEIVDEDGDRRAGEGRRDGWTASDPEGAGDFLAFAVLVDFKVGGGGVDLDEVDVDADGVRFLRQEGGEEQESDGARGLL